MLRLIGITFGIAACMFFSGCMGMGCYQGGCGPSGGLSCNNCDGYSRQMGGPPLRQFASNLACGSGCGDIYVDEWRNYGPNYSDPCESRSGCRPFMSALGNLFGYRDACSQTCYGGDRQFFGMMGCAVTDAVCGCEDYCGDGCADGCFDGGCIDGGCSTGSCSTGSCSGCNSCGLPVSPRSNASFSSLPVSPRSHIANARSNTRPVFRNGGTGTGAPQYTR